MGLSILENMNGDLNEGKENPGCLVLTHHIILRQFLLQTLDTLLKLRQHARSQLSIKASIPEKPPKSS